MNYTPRTRQEADEVRLLAKGEATFQILKASESFNAKNDCQMITLKLRVTDVNGKGGNITDWIMLNEKWDWKLRHLADCIGLTEKYELGTLNSEDLEGNGGALYLSIGKDKNGKMQNNVREYITITTLMSSDKKTSSHQKGTEIADDDIPF